MAKPGLGSAHHRLRATLPKPSGHPCPFCDRPMWADQQLDLDHTTPRALGGANGPVRWAHARCNRSAGGKLGNSIRHGFGKVRSRKW